MSRLAFNAPMRWKPISLAAVLAAVLAALPVAGAEAPEVVGAATVIDGETLVVDGRRFRLWGIDAPDSRQSCRMRGRDYDCGRIAATALMDLVAGTRVRCRPVDGVPDAARCYAGGYELSEGMIHTGWALAMPRDHVRFAPIEKKAAAAKRGLWRGTFEMPWDWRPASR